MNDLPRLRYKLCRELARRELAMEVRATREARRLGDTPPGRVARAIAAHVEAVEPRLRALMRRRGQRVGLGFGRTAGAVLAAVRHAVLDPAIDRAVDRERSFRATLLELRRGADLLRLLRAVATRAGDPYLAGFCDDVLVERLVLAERAERTLGWFADEPARALRAGLRVALHAGASGAR